MTHEPGQMVDVLVVGAEVAKLTASAELRRTGCLELVCDGERVSHRAVEVAR